MLNGPNLGLLYLGGAIKRSWPKHVVGYVDARLSFEEHIAEVVAFKPDIFAISFASPFARVATQVIKGVRSAFPAALIMCGGPHPSADPVSVLEQSPADVCCVGEGEQTIVELLETYQEGRGFESISGIAYRDSSGRIRRTGARKLVEDLDRIPPPDWNLIDFGRYSGWREYHGSTPGVMIPSRGCPFQCVFCSSPVWRGRGTPLRKRSPAKVAEEVQDLYERGVRDLRLCSDEMNADLDWSISVFDSIASLGHEDLHLQCNLRAAPITRDLVLAMRRANCWLCHVGVESGVQRVLDGIKKQITLTQVEKGLSTLQEYGIRAFAFMMLYQVWERNGKLEFETTAEVFKTLAYIASLRLRRLITGFGWAFATPYPGSELYGICLKHGLSVASQSQFFNGNQITIRLPGISRSEMAAAFACGVLLQVALGVTNRDRMTHLGANVTHALSKAVSLMASVRLWHKSS
jgi:radical SAM superfamily enzyme YgiQ (UPF0313 family)